mgnify:CR=1 FL=1
MFPSLAVCTDRSVSAMPETNQTPRRPNSSKIVEMYAPPNDVSVKSSLILIFKHYSSPWKTTMSTDHKEVMMDSQNFVSLQTCFLVQCSGR